MHRLALALAATALTGLAQAQGTYQLDPNNGWTAKQAPVDPERAPLMEVRRLLAEARFDEAFESIDAWITLHEGTDSPYLPEAYLLRGNALLGQEREFAALFDYEKIANKYADSTSFSSALERELDVAILYLNGLRKKSLGIRIDSGVPIAEEIIIRINERLPKSKLAERALMELADYYYRDRDLKMAATAYDCFLILFPKSELRPWAMERRATATIAQYKGPRYDGSGLVEAKYQVEEFQKEFPARAHQIGMDDAEIAWIDEASADQMLSVAQWYLRHGNPASARLTMARLIRKHPSTAATQQAVDIMQKHGWLTSSQEAQPPAAQQTPEAEPTK
jgi:outer membrane protein assembly factor BamD (BamD/ComL family)